MLEQHYIYIFILYAWLFTTWPYLLFALTVSLIGVIKTTPTNIKQALARAKKIKIP